MGAPPGCLSVGSEVGAPSPGESGPPRVGQALLGSIHPPPPPPPAGVVKNSEQTPCVLTWSFFFFFFLRDSLLEWSLWRWGLGHSSAPGVNAALTRPGRFFVYFVCLFFWKKSNCRQASVNEPTPRASLPLRNCSLPPSAPHSAPPNTSLPFPPSSSPASEP